MDTPLTRNTSSASLSSLEYEHDMDRHQMFDFLDHLSLTTQLTKTIPTKARQKASEIKDAAIRQRNKIKGNQDIDRLRQQMIRQMEKMETRLGTATAINSTEKYTFAIGLVTIFFIGYVMGHAPEYLHVIYTVLFCFLMPIRAYTYRKKEYHYFLADLCYFVNFLTLLYLWVFPSSERLFISCYSLTTGTLSWAVITWRNSLVLHSLDKTTSAFIHIFPPVLFHVIVHVLDMDYKSQRFPGAVKVESWKMVQGLVWTSIAYAIWQALYHFFITIRRKDKIRAGRVTSFEWLRRSYSKTPLGKFVNGLPEPFPVVAFTAIQFGYQLGTMLFCPIWYSYGYLSGCFMTFILFTASYNGATYYIDVFGKRFQKELQLLQAEVAQWQDTNQMIISPNLMPNMAHPEKKSAQSVWLKDIEDDGHPTAYQENKDVSDIKL